MSRLHIYTVHVNPSLPLPYEAAQFVEEGFSWKAFFFAPLWTLYHRLWWWTIAILIANGSLFHLMNKGGLTHTGYTILHLAVHLLVGFYANDWRRAKFKKQGYITADVVTGDSLLRAELRFFDRYFSARSNVAFAS